MQGWRVVIVSSRAKLELKMNYLVVRGEEKTRRVLLDEISVLIIENTGCALTCSLLEAFWKNKINVVFCDSAHNPGAQLLPLYGNYEANARIFSQLEWNIETKEEVWAEIVRMKIEKQAQNIKKFDIETSNKLLGYMAEVCPGDYTNREGHAAKVYFNELFHHSFSRAEDCFENHVLNYGYSILLSCVNRQVIASGYLTQVGIFHRNVFNHFNLSCDLMEPFRPFFDRMISTIPKEDEMSRETKYLLANQLNEEVWIDNIKTTLQNAIQIFVRSVLDALDRNDLSLIKHYSYEF